MRNISNFIIIFILWFYAIQSCGQTVLPDYLIAKQMGGKILVKWEPKSIKEWKYAMQSGYEVQLLDGHGSLLMKKIVKPKSYTEFNQLVNAKTGFLLPFYKGAIQLMYPEKNVSDEQDLSKVLSGQSTMFIDSLKLGLLVYTGIYDMELCKAMGLGTDFDIKSDRTYTVVLTIGNEVRKVQVTKSIENPIPTVSGKWGDKNVEMAWETNSNSNHYYGYIIHRSEDGIRYTQKDSLPVINNNKNGVAGFPPLTVKDSFPLNYKTYYYQIRGFDYFGTYSKSVNGVIGYGYDEMQLSPMITFADQTEDNKAHIQWDILGKDVHLLDRFTLFRADSTNGKYTIVKDSISKNDREIYFNVTLPNAVGSGSSKPNMYIKLGNEFYIYEKKAGVYFNVESGNFVTQAGAYLRDLPINRIRWSIDNNAVDQAGVAAKFFDNGGPNGILQSVDVRQKFAQFYPNADQEIFTDPLQTYNFISDPTNNQWFNTMFNNLTY